MRIKELFEATGMSKKDFCTRAGISRVSFDDIIKGDTSPKANIVEKVAKALGVPCGALFDDWQDPTSKEFYAFVRNNGINYTANTIDELKDIIDVLSDAHINKS